MQSTASCVYLQIYLKITLRLQITSSILKVLKVTSLQCFYSIFKEKLWMEFSIFDVSYRYLIKVARYVQNTKKMKFVKF